MAKQYLRRYTDLTSLIYSLSTRTLTLLDPESWDDHNDSHYLTVFKDKMALNTVLALCFTETAERYHFWRVFANESSGVCVEYDRAKLLRVARRTVGIKVGPVTYFTLSLLESVNRDINDLPYLKRLAFKDEREVRVLFTSDHHFSKLDISMPLTCITKVTLSPRLHISLADKVIILLRSIDGCDGLKIVRSTLTNNERWKSYADALSRIDANRATSRSPRSLRG